MSKIIPMQISEMTAVKKALTDQHLSYVLITCTPPSEKGEMSVELAYEGDRDFIAYLVESAQVYLD